MRARAGVVVGVAAVMLLAGCVIQADPDDRDRGDGGAANRGGREQVTCAESASITLDGERVEYDVTGDCAEVIVRGNDLDVRMASSTSLRIEGRDNDVESSGDLGAVEIAGDENDVEARTIASIDVQGNGNDLDARNVGSVEISGDDNSVEADNDPQPVRVTGNGNTVERS
ncbi:DUF3060 domain-containing protein [Agromyces salentinus]|uniref:DUF3060 domain-containing protein n=1 Tax=Agromyces salentinus TaxID=269421 RepID=A0ABN2MVQ5_9MICO|nr:DUF3060 domain-containing protein [Agromyces salentinus]